MEDVERKNDTDGWIKIEQKDSYKNNTTPLVLTTTNNMFAILSVSNNPTTKQAAPVAVPSPISCKTDNKTIMFSPKEHRRQCRYHGNNTYGSRYDNCARMTTCSSITASQ
jgi:hypothetical protein